MSAGVEHELRMQAKHLAARNIEIIKDKLDILEVRLREARSGCEKGCYKEIDSALHEIVGLVSGCRGRVQFCHGVAALKKLTLQGGSDDRE